MQTKQLSQNVLVNQAGLVTLGDAYETFFTRALVDVAPSTKKYYQHKLGILISDLGVSTPICQVTSGDLLDWYAMLKKHNHYSQHTLHGFVRTVRRFFKWSAQSGVIESNPAHPLALPRLPKGAEYGIRDQHAAAILAVVAHNPRDYALLRFLEATGCRAGGVVALTLDDIHVDSPNPGLQRRVMLHEKGQKSRAGFLTPGALAALRAWLNIRPAIKSRRVFLGRLTGRPWKPITYWCIRGLLDRSAAAAKLPPGAKYSAHQWRHRRARRWLEQGMDLARVSQLLGHSDVSVTVRHYGQFAVGNLQAGFDQFTQDF